MSIKALQEYTRFSKYAKYDPNHGRRELWEEQVSRVFDMHRNKFGEELISQFQEDFDFAEKMVNQKRVLGSQRALQFGGDPIIKKNARMYNCTVSYCDRPRFFQECMYLLLCGCGTGFSVQAQHIGQLPAIKQPSQKSKSFVIPDSIEGWADAVGVLMSSYFEGPTVPFPKYQGFMVDFDFSQIRPEGSPLSSGGKAPGPDGLQASLVKISYLLEKCCKLGNKLAPINAYDICMHASDAVLSGGIRRSATICIFSPHDDDMLKAKTGSWFIDNPQRGRSNNSVLLVRDETTKEQFDEIMESVKHFGEPGFIWSDNAEALYNPCVEIGFYARLSLKHKDVTKRIKEDPEFAKIIDKEKEIQGNTKELSGWSFCNLCEINVKKAKTEEEFMDACRAAAVIGTLQASYDHFEYLGPISDMLVKREALLGVSMTGMADTPEIAFDPKIQRRGAKLILEVNERISQIIGINKSARATCVKPAGTTSCILGTASGIHPHHATRYFRKVQANKLENPLQYFRQFNPTAVEESVWSQNNTDVVITFLCEVPDGAKTKNQVDALTLLGNVKLTQQNWVEAGTRIEECVRPWIRHNVSNTINIRDDEWNTVGSYLYKNRKWFAGVSMLPMSGDKDYPQAPFTAVFTPTETVREYGDGSLFASGLIVDGLREFEDLWKACDCVLGIGEILDVESLRTKINEDMKTNGVQWKAEGLSADSPDKLLQAWLEHNVFNYQGKVDWIRRAKQFAERYLDGNDRKMTYCLKDVTNWKTWCDLNRVYVDVDWSDCYEESAEFEVGFGRAGEACSGGACDLGDLGLAIDENKKNKSREIAVA